MPETITRRQTRVIHPDSITVSNEAPGRRPPTRRGRRRGESLQTDEATNATDALLDALASDDNIKIADDFDLNIDDSALDAPEARRRGDHDRADDAPSIQIEIDVKPDENAVVLVESDGVYVWQLPTVNESGPRRRGAAAKRTLSFTIDASSSPEASGPRRRGGERSGRRGLIDWFAKNVFGRVRTIVLKFVARKAVDAAGRYLERNIKPGLIAITGEDSSKWNVDDTPTTPALPTDTPARILLMIHGTFSTTLGSFGVLAQTSAGKAFLGGAFAQYDAILAYDHATLGAWPRENARDVAEALQRLNAPAGSVVDVVAFSRGGLVSRLLIEEMLPATAGALLPGKAVFVGCTALADQENWKTLLDVMTNLTVAAGRGLTFLGAGVAGKIIEQTVKTLGTFVQAIVDAAVTDEMVPGIAAMSPRSALVKRLNDPNATPGDDPSAYFAIGSDFEPKLFSSDASSPLSKRLLRALADLGVDALMKETNDLVVDTEAMAQFGAHAGRLAEELFWEKNAAIFHTNYFAQPEVADAIHEWLLDESAETSEAVAAADPLTLDAGAEVSEISRALQRERNDALVVIHRPRYGYYVRTAKDIKTLTHHAHPDDHLRDVLDLHESDLAETHSGTGLIRASTSGAVRLDGDKVVEAMAPTAVVVEEEAAPARRNGGAIAASAPAPVRRAGPRVVMRKAAADSPSRPAARRGRRPSDAGEDSDTPEAVAEEATCHFAAEMQKSVPLDRTADLTVTVSREEIELAAGMAAGTARGKVRLADPIKLIVTAEHNCDVVGKAEITLDVPDEGSPERHVFSVKGRHPGPGEIYVDAYQGEDRLARIVLQPEFVATGMINAAALVSTRDIDPASIKLRIYEQKNPLNQAFALRFVMESRELDINLDQKTVEFGVPHKAYIDSLYEDIEGRWGRGPVFNRFMADLRTFGASLYEDLVPKEIRAAIWKHREAIGCIEVISHDPVIPWEALHVVEPDEQLPPNGGNMFLAELGLIRWTTNISWPPTSLPIRPGRARHVIPEYLSPENRLDGADAERTMLQDLLASKPIEATSRAVKEVLYQPGAFDLLHFACHGQASEGRIWEASLLMAGSTTDSEAIDEDHPLTLDEIDHSARLRADDGTRPIVFLNACQAGKSGKSLTGTGGMAQAFIGGGAGLFIGSLWSIGDKTALTFAETFYRQMLDGKTATQAIKAARTASKIAEEPTWLAYNVYGHPYARIEMSKA